MSGTKKILLVAALVLITAGALLTVVKVHPKRFLSGAAPPLTLQGSALQDNADPALQTPLGGVSVTAASGVNSVTTKTGPSGLFSLTLDPGLKRGQRVTLTFEAPSYKTLQITPKHPGDQLYIARLELRQMRKSELIKEGAPAKMVNITNVQVRYTFKNESQMDVGSLAKQFEAPNKGNVPCRNKAPCSPDGRWKATATVFHIDAQRGDEFRDVRVSCVAGPCAFTTIQSTKFPAIDRKIDVSVLNWSDTTDFLVEADVLGTMVTDVVQRSYPFLVDGTMNFALPPSSEGPCIEADLDGQDMVFPIGPDLLVSIANCSLEVSQDGNKLYRCQLKPGYQFH
jgi:hypothetical protein